MHNHIHPVCRVVFSSHFHSSLFYRLIFFSCKVEYFFLPTFTDSIIEIIF